MQPQMMEQEAEALLNDPVAVQPSTHRKVFGVFGFVGMALCGAAVFKHFGSHAQASVAPEDEKAFLHAQDYGAYGRLPGPYGAQQGYGAGVGHGPIGAAIANHPPSFVPFAEAQAQTGAAAVAAPAAPVAPAAAASTSASGLPGPYSAQQGYGAGVAHGPTGAPIAVHPEGFVAHADAPAQQPAHPFIPGVPTPERSILPGVPTPEQPGCGPAVQPAPQPGCGPAVQPAPQPGCGPAVQPAPQPGCGPARPILPGVPTPEKPVVLPAPAGQTPVIHPQQEDPAAKVGHMERKEIHELTRAHDEDDIEVRWLMSPLLKAHAGHVLGMFGLWHVGVGFHNKRTGLDTTFQFAAVNFHVQLVVPEVDRANNKLVWDTAADVYGEEGQLDVGYWIKRERIATVKGSHYNELLKWMPGIVDKYKNYFLFNLQPSNVPLPQPHLPGSNSADNFPPGGATCSDVAMLIVNQLRDIAGASVFLKDFAVLGRSDAMLWVQPGTTPRQLDMTPGSADFEFAMHWFEQLNLALGPVKAMYNTATGLTPEGTSYSIPQLAYDSLMAIQQADISGQGIYMDATWNYYVYKIPDVPVGVVGVEAAKTFAWWSFTNLPETEIAFAG